MSLYSVIYDAEKSEEFERNIKPLLNEEECHFIAYKKDMDFSIEKDEKVLVWLGDEALYTNLVNDFIALEDELNALYKAIDTQDYPSIARIAHIFTTALRYIGAFTLAELASSIELSVKRGEQANEKDFSAKLDLFYESLKKVRVQLNAAQ